MMMKMMMWRVCELFRADGGAGMCLGRSFGRLSGRQMEAEH